ncbi:MAG: DMT family transporter [Lachnospiraceae bacterium]|nr:DMT family transporter [Lachnospiraceae bacterium]
MSNKVKTLTKNAHALGIFFVILDSLAFSLMSVSVRMAGDLPTFQKAFFRNAIAAVIALVSLSRTQEGFHVKKGSWPLLFARAAFGTTGLVLNFWAIDHIALADANILNKMSPFFAMIASIVLLAEVPNSFEWVTLVIGFCGAAFIVKPTAGIASLPALLALVGGMGAGIAYSCVRKLGNKGERGPVIVAFFSVFSCLVCLPSMVINFVPMTPRQWFFLIMAGVCGAAGQFTVTRAYQLAPAKEISVFDYSQVMFASIWGFMFFGEIPDRWSVLGYIIIITTAVVKWYYNVFVQDKKKKVRTSAAGTRSHGAA